MVKKLGWLCLVLSICFAAQGQIQTAPQFIPIRIMPTVSIPDFEALSAKVGKLEDRLDRLASDVDHLFKGTGDTGSAAWIGWLALLVAAIAAAIAVIKRK